MKNNSEEGKILRAQIQTWTKLPPEWVKINDIDPGLVGQQIILLREDHSLIHQADLITIVSIQKHGPHSVEFSDCRWGGCWIDGLNSKGWSIWTREENEIRTLGFHLFKLRKKK